MALQVKCVFCGNQVDKDKAISYAPRRYVCSDKCYKDYDAKIKYKPQLIKPSGEINDRRLCTDAIQKIYNKQGFKDHQINWQLITAVLKRMMDEHKDYTYRGIVYTLWYMQKIKQMDLFSAESNTVLALVPFNYNEAKQFALECYNIRKSVKDFEINDEVIVIKKKEKVVKDYIDMENLI